MLCPAICAENFTKDSADVESNTLVEHPAARARLEAHSTRKRALEAPVSKQLPRHVVHELLNGHNVASRLIPHSSTPLRMRRGRPRNMPLDTIIASPNATHAIGKLAEGDMGNA